MNSRESTRVSRFLSLVLRHEPDAAGVVLDCSGWTEVNALLSGCTRVGMPLTHAELLHIVAMNDKKRFEFNADGTRIRASQGHSIEVVLDYAPHVPPEQLYHGTATRFLGAIRGGGLQKMARHHVHLSADSGVAHEVGSRHGKPVVLTIRASDMHRAGHVFYQSTNGVWLVDAVSAEFIEFPAL